MKIRSVAMTLLFIICGCVEGNHFTGNQLKVAMLYCKPSGGIEHIYTKGRSEDDRMFLCKDGQYLTISEARMELLYDASITQQ